MQKLVIAATVRGAFIVALALCVALPLAAQEAKLFTAVSEHYRISSETSQSQAEEISRRMEASLRMYNDLFHFDLSLLPAKLNVRVMRDMASFNAYLTKVLSQTRTDFVFIAYSDPEKSELLCFPKEEKAFSASLVHQGCIQFLKAFVANPPIWLREGSASALEAAIWDPKGSAYTPKPNLGGLEELKAILWGESPQKLIPFSDFLMYTRELAQAQAKVFYPQAWGLVHFLLAAPEKAYNRMLWDAIGALDSKAGLDENSKRVRNQAFSWVSEEKLRQDYESFILAVRTAGELLRDGVDAYGKGDFAKAEEALTRSLELEPQSGPAWYYLGLVAYSKKDYAKAEDLYMKAFQLGTNPALINYAIGINAFAAGKLDAAAKYLKMARDADKAAYGDKVDALQKRIEAGR
jgi:tetratricopeptide (TPR) repeat protein